MKKHDLNFLIIVYKTILSARKVTNFSDFTGKAEKGGFALLLRFAFLFTTLHFYSEITGEEKV